MVLFYDDKFETIQPESTGTPPALGDVFNLNALNQMFVGSQTGFNYNFQQQYTKTRDYVKQKYNMDLVEPDTDGLGFAKWQDALNQDYKSVPLDNHYFAKRQSDFEQRRNLILEQNAQLEELKKTDPNIQTYFDTQKHLQDLGQSISDQTDQINAESKGFLSGAAAFAGGMAGSLNPMANPVNVATMGIGGYGLGKSAVTQMATRVLSEAGVGVALEAANQEIYYPDNRKAFGAKQQTTEERLTDLAFAAGIGATFQGAVEGGRAVGNKLENYRAKMKPTDDQTLDVFSLLQNAAIPTINSAQTQPTQMTRSKWDGLIAKYPDKNYTADDIKKPEAQADIAKAELNNNRNIITKAIGRNLSLGEDYIASISSAEETINIIKNANNDEPASIAFTTETISRNPNIFYESGDVTQPIRRAKQVYDVLITKANDAWVAKGGAVERRITTNTKRILHDVKTKLNMSNPVNRIIQNKLETQILFEQDLNPHSVLTLEGQRHIDELDAYEKMLQRDPTEPLPTLPDKLENPKEWFTPMRAQKDQAIAIARYIPEAKAIYAARKSIRSNAKSKQVPFHEWLKNQGGIVSKGGELEARGIDAKTFKGGVIEEFAGNQSKGYTKTIDKKTGFAVGGMEERNISGSRGLFRKAIEAGYFPEFEIDGRIDAEASFANSLENQLDDSYFYDALQQSLFEQPRYTSQSMKDTQAQEDLLVETNPYGEYFQIDGRDTVQNIAEKIYQANKDRDVEGLDYKIGELEAIMRDGYKAQGLSPELATKQIAVVRNLFDAYLARYGDTGLRNAITAELDKLQVEYRNINVNAQQADKTFFQSTRADLEITTPFVEADYRPSVTNWARAKFGKRTAPDGSLAWQNFTQWFGDSKVVNDGGEPLVVYHGTQSDFETFDLNKTSRNFAGSGFYFTSDAEYASFYAVDESANIMPVYLNMKNPMSVVTIEQAAETLKISADEFLGLGGEELKTTLNNNGYDGIKAGEVFVIQDPNQIKSVFNQGAFSPDDNRILYQSVFHGSPYRDIEKTGFKLDKIGTGEGAQAYGWGLYFTKTKSIAEQYKNNVSLQKITINNKTYKPRTKFAKENEQEIIDIIATAYETYDGNISKIKSDFMGKAAYEMRNAQNGVHIEAYKTIRDAKTISKPDGQLYEVKIPEDDVMLLWDKPLNEQSNVLKALRQPEAQKALADANIGFEVFNQTGNELYSKIALSKTPKETSLLLNELGIKGIKYLDGTSRKDGEGTYNYVVFDDTAIDVIDTYYQQSTQLNKTGDDFENVVKGSITFDKDATIITLSPDADASTFIHEMGHFAFRMHERLANHSDAPAELKADYATMRREVNALDGERLSIDQEEMLARKFEAYLRTGIAPNAELKSLFSTLSDWLVGVYQKFTDLGVKLSDDIIDVFDRMLTSNVDNQYKDFEYYYEPIAIKSPLPSYTADISLSAIERAQEGDDSDAYYDALFEDFKTMEEAKDFTIDIDGEKYDYARILNELDKGETIKKIISECKI